MSELHPSQLHQYMQLCDRAKWASWGCLTTSILLLSLSSSLRKESKQYKPWLFGSSVAVLFVGKSQRRTVKQLQIALGDFEEISRFNFQSWVKQRTQVSAQLAVTMSAAANWQPDNLITDPVQFIQQKQKHIALIGGTGDGKSTFTQYFSTKIGGRAIVYDSDAKPEDWAWLNPDDVIGRKGNFAAINTAMGDDLKTLEELVQLRGESGDAAIAGLDRFLIAEEFPILVDECDNASGWIKRHAKRGRRYKQFILVLAQNDTAENFGLQGDKDTLYSCFCLVRLGQFAREHAKRLKIEGLEQWLKDGGKKRFMIDDHPCELDLSSFTATEIASSNSPAGLLTAPERTEFEPLPTFNDPKLNKIVEVWNVKQDWVSARDCQRSGTIFGGMEPDDIRYLFVTLETQGHGETAGSEGKTKWRLRASSLNSD